MHITCPDCYWWKADICDYHNQQLKTYRCILDAPFAVNGKQTFVIAITSQLEILGYIDVALAKCEVARNGVLLHLKKFQQRPIGMLQQH